jgi:Domain of unknown function (DUF1918)
MKGLIGDRIEIPGKHVGEEARHGEIVAVHGFEGDPPFEVRWDDGHKGLFFPGPDAVVQHVVPGQARPMARPGR